MTTQELRDLMETHGIRPVHDRGQHFLLDNGVVDKMVAAADIRKGDRVLEIGPGPGILTERLLDAGAEVVAVELDLKLRGLLRERFGNNPNFHLLEGNILDFTNEQLVLSFSRSLEGAQAPYKLVTNLPYSITAATFQKFLLESPSPRSITMLIQREVVDRVLAKPGDMSSLAVLVQTYATAQRIVNVPAGSFFPAPKVESAVIHMEREKDEELAAFFGGYPPDRFFAVVRAGFAEKRKQLKNTLRVIQNDEKKLNQAFLEAGIRPDARPETLGIEEWRKLVIALTR